MGIMKQYFLATNEKDVFHYGKLLQGQVLETGQPKLFDFDTKQELIDKLKEYGQDFVEFEKTSP